MTNSCLLSIFETDNPKRSFWYYPKVRFQETLVITLAELFIPHSTRFYQIAQVSEFSTAAALRLPDGLLQSSVTACFFLMQIFIPYCLFSAEHCCRTAMRFFNPDNFSSLQLQVFRFGRIFSGGLFSIYMLSAPFLEVNSISI